MYNLNGFRISRRAALKGLVTLSVGVAISNRVGNAQESLIGAIERAQNEAKSLLRHNILNLYSIHTQLPAPGVPGFEIGPERPSVEMPPATPGFEMPSGVPGFEVGPGIPGFEMPPGVPSFEVAPRTPGFEIPPGTLELGNLDSRKRLARKLVRASENSLSISIHREWQPLQAIASEYDLDLVPEPESLPISPVVDFSRSYSLWQVLLDILIDTLNLGISRERLLDVLEDDALRRLLQDVEHSLKNADWVEFLRSVIKLFRYVFAPRFRNFLITTFGRQVLRGPLTRLVGYLVPYAGWLYLIDSFVNAITQYLKSTEMDYFR